MVNGVETGRWLSRVGSIPPGREGSKHLEEFRRKGHSHPALVSRSRASILSCMIEQSGDPKPQRRRSSAELLPVVYDELRELARARMRRLQPGQTLEATALVHEVYARLGTSDRPRWDHKGHFFGAAALAMRNIIVDEARRKQADKHGGNHERVTLSGIEVFGRQLDVSVLDIDEALTELQSRSPRPAEVVQLRFFGGLTNKEIAKILEVSTNTIERDWAFARSWLYQALSSLRDGETV